MALFNIDDLRNELQTKDFSWEKKNFENLNEYTERKLNEQARNFSSYKTYDVFLSHSMRDGAAIIQLAKILENYGLSVYIDWVEDKQLDRSKVTIETAKIIRDRLKLSRCFLLALSSNSAKSSWVQWELGLGDGQKNGKVAIVPLMTNYDTNPEFYRQEYLGLYPYIDYTGSSIWVNGYKYVDLKDWLRNENPLQQVLYS
jgi:hypothetical protein